MKRVNCLLVISVVCMTFSLLGCTAENEDINENTNLHSVVLLDESGNLILMTKGISTLPSGSTVSGTGYYANGDNCTLTYYPASGYNSTCSWDWHDGSFVQTAGSSSASIRRDYQVTITETLAVKRTFQITINTNGNGLWIAGGGTYEEGSVCLLTAKGANFSGWVDRTGGINVTVSTSQNYRFTVTKDRMLFAVYNL